jgi:predicted DNA-binding ribbon-helix-helix protein
MSVNESLQRSLVVKHSIVLNGHKTSVSLEHAFWIELKREAASRDMTLGALIDVIDSARVNDNHGNLSSACRCHVLARMQLQHKDTDK